MEDKQLWDFEPAVTHGDLHEDSLLIEGERVVAVTGWTDLHIGDPADDFAWLTAVGAPGFRDKVLEAYGRHRVQEADPHLMRRAALSAEFALAQWLVRGKATENSEMVEEALTLLRQLAADIETYGGQPIALTPLDEDEVKDPAETQDSRPVVRQVPMPQWQTTANGPTPARATMSPRSSPTPPQTRRSTPATPNRTSPPARSPRCPAAAGATPTRSPPASIPLSRMRWMRMRHPPGR